MKFSYTPNYQLKPDSEILFIQNGVKNVIISKTYFINKRKKVQLEDIYESMESVLAHRIKLKASLRYTIKPEEYLAQQFKRYIEESEKSGDLP